MISKSEDVILFYELLILLMYACISPSLLENIQYPTYDYSPVLNHTAGSHRNFTFGICVIFFQVRHLQVTALKTQHCISVVEVMCSKFIYVYIKHMYNTTKDVTYLSVNLICWWATFCFILQLISFKSFKAICLSNSPFMLFG